MNPIMLSYICTLFMNYVYTILLLRPCIAHLYLMCDYFIIPIVGRAEGVVFFLQMVHV